MASQRVAHLTEDEYVEIQRNTEFRYEYFHLRENSSDWHFREISGMHQSIRLVTLDTEIPLTAIYEDIQFDR
jgi:hypothetical protein